MGLYDTFSTDSTKEVEGTWLDYGDFQVKIAYAGGANKKFSNLLEQKLKPLRRALEAGAVSNERSNAILAEVYAKTIVLDWQTVKDPKKPDEMVQGIEGPKGDIIEFNVDNVIMTFKNVPNLFTDIRQQAEAISNFKAEELEAESKN